MSDEERIAAIRKRVAAEGEWTGGTDAVFWCQQDRRWLLAALTAAEERAAKAEQWLCVVRDCHRPAEYTVPWYAADRVEAIVPMCKEHAFPLAPRYGVMGLNWLPPYFGRRSDV